MKEIIAPERATDRQLVDTIVYLASLVAQPDTIDRTLDTLRIVTAHWEPETALSVGERVTLEQLARDLKDHLIHDDPLRNFTEEALEDRLWVNLHGKRSLRSRLTLGFVPAAIGCIVLAMATLIIPLTPRLLDRVFLVIPIFLVLTTIVNAWFYLSSLREFKKELRHAFLYLCGGALVLGAQFVHFAYISLSDQGALPLYKYGGLPFITFAAFVIMYLGLRKYARLLSIHKWYMALWSVIGLLLITTGLAVLTAYALPVSDKGYFMFSLGSTLGITVMSLLSSQVTRVILRSVAPIYAQSIRRLYVFLLAVFVGAIVYTVAILWFKELSGDILKVVLGACATPALLLLLYSGYSFKKETSK